MRWLLDTNIVIDLLRGASAPVARALRLRQPRDVLISSIVTHELYFGAFKSARAKANRERLDALRFEVLAFDKEDSIAAGEVRAMLAMDGMSIGPFDVLIAGQALCRGLVLVTANTPEFSRVKGLALEDWTRPV